MRWFCSEGSKGHNLQAVELSQRSQTAMQIVSNPPVVLIKADDVETNTGPTNTQKQVWICDICHTQIHVRKQISIRCNRIDAQLSAMLNIQIPGSAIYTDNPDSQLTQT